VNPITFILSFLSSPWNPKNLRVDPRALFSCVLLVATVPLMPLRLAAQTDAKYTSRSGIYTTAQAERGRMTYALSCRSCHTAASHTGVTFAKFWKDRTVGDLFGFVSTQMPKNEPGSLAPEQYADVLAYLLRMNAMPAGTTELLADSSALAQIRIELPTKSSKASPASKPAKQTSKPTSKTRP
jgi:mono/diheme cytochrome c family protein